MIITLIYPKLINLNLVINQIKKIFVRIDNYWTVIDVQTKIKILKIVIEGTQFKLNYLKDLYKNLEVR